MKLASFLFIFSSLIIGLFAKEVEEPIEEYTYEIKELFNKISIKNNTIFNFKFSNYPPDFVDDFSPIEKGESIVTWSLDESIEKYSFIELKGKDVTDDFTIIKLYFKEVTDELPRFQFIMTGDNVTNGSRPINIICELKDEIVMPTVLPDKEIISGIEDYITVESNSVLRIHFGYAANAGGSWNLANSEEISESEYITYLGSRGGSDCTSTNIITQQVQPPLCHDGSTEILFHIKDVPDESLLPKIVIFFGKSLLNDTDKYYEITLKLQSSTTTTSTTSTTTTVTPTLDNIECFSQPLGYPCCKKQKVVYTDESGPWGVENGKWCGIKLCSYQSKDGYPVCKTTTKVVYTDSDDWGVENGKWCIMCK